MTRMDENPLHVFLTFDVEVWCGGWGDIDAAFPGAFRRYVYGPSRAGNYALPKTLEMLNDHGLKGVFFVEPLFAAHFGVEPLAEIVSLIREAGQEVQLHLHPEWQDEAKTPLIENHAGKRQHLFMYDVDEQTALIGHGLRLLREAGADSITAFRAGSFACNADTFTALARNGIRYDSSLNLTMDHSGGGLGQEARRPGSHLIGNVLELPLTISKAGQGWRHMQIGACSFDEMKDALQRSRESGWRYFNVLSHNFEMLVPGAGKPDRIVVKRFGRLCDFLERHRSVYPTVGFDDDAMFEESAELSIPETDVSSRLIRHAEQAYRRMLAAWDKLVPGQAGTH